MNFLNVIKNALLKVTPDVFHYSAPSGQAFGYIVWNETGEASSEWCDNKQSNQSLTGDIRYFTKNEYDGNFQKIQHELNEAGVPFNFENAEYNEETGVIEYLWNFEVINTNG